MIAYLLVIHFVADFLLQSREMGKTKSSNWRVLLAHLAIQATAFTLGLWPFFGLKTAIAFALLNAGVHGVIDWNIWRLYKLSVLKRFPEIDWADPKAASTYDYWNDSWFYHTIGLDQLLHGLTLVALAALFL